MKTGMPASWTVQKQLEKVREENWRTAREGEGERMMEHGEKVGRLCPVGESSEIKKLTQGETKTGEKVDRAGANTGTVQGEAGVATPIWTGLLPWPTPEPLILLP